MLALSRQRIHTIDWWKEHNPQYLRAEARMLRKFFWPLLAIALVFVCLVSVLNLLYNKPFPLMYGLFWFVAAIVAATFIPLLIVMRLDANRFDKWANEKETEEQNS